MSANCFSFQTPTGPSPKSHKHPGLDPKWKFLEPPLHDKGAPSSRRGSSVMLCLLFLRSQPKKSRCVYFVFYRVQRCRTKAQDQDYKHVSNEAGLPSTYKSRSVYKGCFLLWVRWVILQLPAMNEFLSAKTCTTHGRPPATCQAVCSVKIPIQRCCPL